MIQLYQPDIKQLYPVRDNSVHKGSCGKIAVVAGSLTMAGAAILTSIAALRSGAGLVYLFTISELIPYINVAYPELICIPLESKNGLISSVNNDYIVQKVKDLKCDSVVIGPGMGREPDTQILIRKLTLDFDWLPTILDADALFSLSVSYIKKIQHPLILTPHLGEFLRLFSSLDDASYSREEQAYYAFDSIKHIVVLKGHKTVVASSKGVYINHTGNAGMATAGSGDVLAGMIANFSGQKESLEDSCVLSVYCHGLAGDRAFLKFNDGLIASDILSFIGPSIQKIKGEA